MRVRTKGKLGQQQTVSCNARVQRAMRRRIGDVDAGAKNRRRPSARIERGDVRDTVDTPRHPTDDRGAGAREAARQLTRHSHAVRRRLTRADDRDTWMIQYAQVADAPQSLRRIRQIEQGRRIVRMAKRNREGFRIHRQGNGSGASNLTVAFFIQSNRSHHAERSVSSPRRAAALTV